MSDQSLQHRPPPLAVALTSACRSPKVIVGTTLFQMFSEYLVKGTRFDQFSGTRFDSDIIRYGYPLVFIPALLLITAAYNQKRHYMATDHLPPDVRNLVRKIEEDYRVYNTAPAELQRNKDVQFAALHRNRDKEFVHGVIEKYEDAVFYVDDELLNDHGFVMHELSRPTSSLHFPNISERLRNREDVVTAACLKGDVLIGDVLEHIPSELLEDEAFYSDLITRLQTQEGVVIEYEFASEALRSSKAFALIAASVGQLNLNFALGDVATDPEVVAAAALQENSQNEPNFEIPINPPNGG